MCHLNFVSSKSHFVNKSNFVCQNAILETDLSFISDGICFVDKIQFCLRRNLFCPQNSLLSNEGNSVDILLILYSVNVV